MNIFTIAIALIIFAGTNAFAQVSDFDPADTQPDLTWTDNDGYTISNWSGSANNSGHNYEITTSSISHSGPNAPNVLHLDAYSGSAGSSPQWVATSYDGYNWNSTMDWTFWFGRRQDAGFWDKNIVWLYVDRNLNLDQTWDITGIRVVWYQSWTEERLRLEKFVDGVQTTLADFTLINSSSMYPVGIAVKVTRTPSGSDAEWTVNLSMPSTSHPNYATSSVPASVDPDTAAQYQRASMIEPNAFANGPEGYISFHTEFPFWRKDAAEYNGFGLGISTPLPVELSTFTAQRRNDRTYLAWETETETNNYGFEIERSLDGADFETIGFMDGYGTTNSPKSYRYTDEETVNASKIAYRLKQIDRDGTFEYSQIAMVNTGATNLTVLENYPNPFNPSTTIRFELMNDEIVTLAVFSVTGEMVASIYDSAPLEAGSHSAQFNADDLPSGTYYYTLITDGTAVTKKMLLVR